jgi:hypothetical protein
MKLEEMWGSDIAEAVGRRRKEAEEWVRAVY